MRQDLGAGDPAAAMSRLADLVADLERYVRSEEDGVFRALRAAGEFADEVDELEAEHRDFAALIASLKIDSADLEAQDSRLLDDLAATGVPDGCIEGDQQHDDLRVSAAAAPGRDPQ